MTNKLLTEIKELGLDHDEVLGILKAHQKAEGSDEEEEEEQEEQEEEEESESTSNDENKDKKVDIDISKLSADITKSVSDSVSKSVSAEIKKQVGKLRGKAPKGVEGNIGTGKDSTIDKNMFEVHPENYKTK